MGGQFNRPTKNKMIYGSNITHKQTQIPQKDQLEYKKQEQEDEQNFKKQVELIYRHSFEMYKSEMPSEMEIYISCINLPNKDQFSQSDCVVFIEEKIEDNRYKLIDKTEIIPNNLNPKFAKSIKIQYSHDHNPILKFTVYDVDNYDESQELKLSDCAYMSEAEIELSDLLEDQNLSRQFNLHNKVKQKSTYKSRQTANLNQGLINLQGYNCDMDSHFYIFKMQLIGIKSKLFLAIRISVLQNSNIFGNSSALQGSGGVANIADNGLNGGGSNAKTWWPIYQTEIKKNEKILNYNEFQIQENKFGDFKSSIIKLEVIQYDFFQLDLQTLESEEVHLRDVIKINHETTIKLSKHGGILKIQEVIKSMKKYNFLDYVYGGTTILPVLGIDFSLYRDEEQNKVINYHTKEHNSQQYNNDYTRCIQQLMNLIQSFEKKQKFLCFGMGAKLPPYYSFVSYHFSLNFDIYQPEICGETKDIIQTYRNIVDKLQFAELTIYKEFFEEIIKFMNTQKFDQKNQTYFLVVLLTSGDMKKQHIKNIVEQMESLTNKPISIMMVGIGSCQFTSILRVIHKIEKRKIRNVLHFVKFDDYKQNNNDQEFIKKVIAKIPEQFINYIRYNNITPIEIGKNLKDSIQNFLKQKKIESALPGGYDYFYKIKDEQYQILTKQLKYPAYLINELFKQGLASTDINYIIDRITDLNKNQEMQLKSINERKKKVKYKKLKLQNPQQQSIFYNQTQKQANENITTKFFRMSKEILARESTNSLSSSISQSQQNSIQNKSQIHQKLQTGESIFYQTQQIGPINPPPLKPKKIVKPGKMRESPFSTHSNKKKVAQFAQTAHSVTENQIIFQSQLHMLNVIESQQELIEEQDINTEQTELQLQCIDNKNICVLCQIQPINIMVMPCGHSFCCKDCYISSSLSKCSICQSKVKCFIINDQPYRETIDSQSNIDLKDDSENNFEEKDNDSLSQLDENNNQVEINDDNLNDNKQPNKASEVKQKIKIPGLSKFN